MLQFPGYYKCGPLTPSRGKLPILKMIAPLLFVVREIGRRNATLFIPFLNALPIAPVLRPPMTILVANAVEAALGNGRIDAISGLVIAIPLAEARKILP